MITTVLFDLDDTLLPMDQDEFLKVYLGGLAAKLAPHGYDPKQLIRTIWQGTAAMVANDSASTNESILWNHFTSVFGAESLKDAAIFEDYYLNEFQSVRYSCGFDPQAKAAVLEIKNMGFRVALATNPLFPALATHSRIRWTGLQPDDFEFVSTYENSCHCKPSLAYYQDVLDTLGVKAEECVMVGNDVTEDMVAEQLGIRVFLLTDCLINKNNTDISAYLHGGFPELLDFIRGLNK